MKENTIKLIIIPLLLLCLAPMPYGYYELVRWSSALAFAYMGYAALEQKVETLPWVYFGLAVLFQPLFKIALGRNLWNVVDVIVAMFLIWTVVSRNNTQKFQ